MTNTEWIYNEAGNWIYGDFSEGVYLSYRDTKTLFDKPLLDKMRELKLSPIALEAVNRVYDNPEETAIVFVASDPDTFNRYLILNGDKRSELEKIYPDKQALEDYYLASPDKSVWSTDYLTRKEDK